MNRINAMDLRSNVHAWEAQDNSAPRPQSKAHEFGCSTCGRTYKAKESLTRHEENHTGATRHICNRCGIGFHRKDLLARHARIHATAKGNAKIGRTGRQRSHRACDGCRAMKTKCDGRDPCSSCAERAHSCTFTQAPHRLSLAHQKQRAATRDSHIPSPSTSSATSMADVSQVQQLQDQDIEHVEPEETTNSAASPLARYRPPDTGGIMDSLTGGSSSGFVIEQSLESGIAPCDINLLSPAFQMGFNQFWPTEELSQPLSWPWLYEESYLQQPPALADFPISSEFYKGASIDHSQTGFHQYGLNHSTSPSAYLDATTNSTTSNGQHTVENIGQSALRSVGIGALRMHSPPTNPEYNPMQVNLGMNKITRSSLGGIELGSETRASGRQVPTASVTRTLSQNTQGIEQKRRVVQKMIDATFQDSPSTRTSLYAQQHSQLWNYLCPEIERAFSLRENETATTSEHHILHQFVGLYFKHFNRLWPLIWQHGLNFEDIPGPLYLTLAMIGSMYAGGNAPAFGFMLHEYVSKVLMLAPTWRLDADDGTYSICQSLLLTQVAALYFGTKKAFSCAQQLGSILVSLARKIRLFDRFRAGRSLEDDPTGKSLPSTPLVSKWIEKESRKRLAFGIFRADTFLSLLLNTRPLLSYEEISLSLPSPYSVWEYSARDLQAYIKMNAAEDDMRRELPFSDLVQITMDREEKLPSLKLGDYELLAFALQQTVWRFSHDPDIFRRLSGRMQGYVPSRPPKRSLDFYDEPLHEQRDLGLVRSGLAFEPLVRPQSADLDDALDWSDRRMRDLQLDYDRTLCALRKWKQSFAVESKSAQGGHDRDLLLSSRLLYHLSFIRLNAETEAFHLLSCQWTDHKRLQRDTVNRIYQWSCSSAAQVAIEHACTIWTVVHKEVQRTDDRRAKFNIIAFISLHHAASVIWAYAGTRDANGSSTTFDRVSRTSSVFPEQEIRFLGDIELCRSNTNPLLNRFACLLRHISPAWVAVSAFATTATVMADNALPLLSELT